MDNATETRGYKVFNSDWTCRGFQFEVGKTFEEDSSPKCCKRGFHFCLKLVDCFNYYNFNPNNKVAKIIAIGEIDKNELDSKCCTNKIKILKELTWNEVLEKVNTGTNCTGYRNSGDWNIADYSSGCFNTEEQKLLFFDKPTEMTMQQWRDSEAFHLLKHVNYEPAIWVEAENMTEVEKRDNPGWEVTGGYLKKNTLENCFIEWWEKLPFKKRKVIQQIPNFDSEKFYQITGIKIN